MSLLKVTKHKMQTRNNQMRQPACPPMHQHVSCGDRGIRLSSVLVVVLQWLVIPTGP